MKTLSVFLFLAVFCGLAQAQPIPELTRYIEREIDAMDHAVEISGVVPEFDRDSSVDEEGWYLRAFMLRLRPYAGLDIKGIGKFLLVPEAELVWEKAVPEGWSIYKPRRPQ